MTHEQFKTVWASMTPVERERVQDKARWEHMTLWAVLNEWPTLVPQKLRPAVEVDS